MAPGLKLDQIVLERRQSKSGDLLNRYFLLIFLLTGFNLYSVVLCLIFQKIEPEHSVQFKEQAQVL